MTSLKDKGSQLYKIQKYQQAADCYSQYVRTQHKDNKNAYFNLALCHFKLKKYHQCIQACNQALDIDPQYSKVYYRLFQAYKQVKDPYNTFISGSNFIKHCTEEQQIKKITPMIKECKQKVSFQTKTKSQTIKTLLNDVSIFIQQASQECIQNNQRQQQIQKLKMTKNQKQYQIALQQRWKQIEVQICDSIQYGTNLAHQFIRNLESEQKNKYLKLLRNIRRKIRQLPIDFQQNKHIQKNIPNGIQQKKHQQLKSDIQKKVNQQQLISKNKQIQLLVQKQNRPQVKSNSPLVKQNTLQVEQNNSQVKQNSSQVEQNNSQSVQKQLQQFQRLQKQQKQSQPAKKQQQYYRRQKQQQLSSQKPSHQSNCQNEDNLVDQKQILALYQQYIELPLKQQADIFQTFKKQIHLIADSPNLDRIQKIQLLIITSKKLKKFTFIMKSYSGKQKSEIESSFRKEKLDRVVPYFFKK